MIPQKVSMSSDSNPYYLDFWEPISRIWKHKFGIHPYLFFVGDSSSAPKNGHGTVVCMPEVKGVPKHTQTQWARFHGVQTDLDSVWITSDIDMIPLSRMYFIDMVREIPDDCIVSLDSDRIDYFTVCYNMAKGRVFADALQLKSDFSEDVQFVFHSTRTHSHTVQGKMLENWHADEQYSSRMFCLYRHNHPEKVIQMFRRDKFQDGRRIDRSDWRYDPVLLKQGWYLDCHSARPYSEHKEQIEQIISLSMCEGAE